MSAMLPDDEPGDFLRTTAPSDIEGKGVDSVNRHVMRRSSGRYRALTIALGRAPGAHLQLLSSSVTRLNSTLMVSTHDMLVSPFIALMLTLGIVGVFHGTTVERPKTERS